MDEETFEQTCRRLEHYETDPWAARAILKHEILTRRVVDPCCGTGILGKAASADGYDLISGDVRDWGFPETYLADFLAPDDYLADRIPGTTVFINPPFKLATDFVERALALGARKVVCFQRFPWWESGGRKEFWARCSISRVYVCGDRATCWRHDLPKDEFGNRYSPETGERLAGTSTAHAFFVFEPGHPPGPLLGHIWKADAV